MRKARDLISHKMVEVTHLFPMHCEVRKPSASAVTVRMTELGNRVFFVCFKLHFTNITQSEFLLRVIMDMSKDFVAKPCV